MGGIRHVGIAVLDLEQSISFWKAIGFDLRFKIERQEPFIGEIVGYRGAHLLVAMLHRKGAVVELIEYRYPRARRFGASPRSTCGQMHVCLEDDGELAALLEEHARPIGKATIPDGPQAGATAAYYYGPDNELIELYTPPR